MIEVEYKVSLHHSRFLAYQSKAREKGVVKLFICNIWEQCGFDFTKFIIWLDFLTVLERVCLERAFQKIRMKDRCKPYKNFHCKMEWIAYHLFFKNKWWDREL